MAAAILFRVLLPPPPSGPWRIDADGEVDKESSAGTAQGVGDVGGARGSSAYTPRRSVLRASWFVTRT
jgi:hypothetical protein